MEFNQFYRKYVKYAYSVLNRINSRIHKTDKDDIIQEVFIYISSNYSRMDLEKGIKTYIQYSVRTKYIDYYRKTHRRSICDIESVKIPVSSQESDDSVLIIEKARKLLVKREKEVFELMIASFSSTEIAQILNEKPVSVRGIIHRIRTKLEPLFPDFKRVYKYKYTKDRQRKNMLRAKFKRENP